jgi:hypothetical protein
MAQGKGSKTRWNDRHDLDRRRGSGRKIDQLPVQEPDPARRFDRAWATTVIEKLLKDLRGVFAGKRKVELFEVLNRCLIGGVPSASYAQEAARLGMTKEALQVHLSRFKNAFGNAIRREIGNDVGSRDEIR